MLFRSEYFPAGSISFRKACDILQVTTIESKDLIVDPIYDDIDEKQFHIIRDLKIYALILAGFQDSENWATIYDGYREKIQRMNLWRCSAISLRYDKDNAVCQNLKKFYHEKGSTEFYYVNSLDERRVFKPFVESFIE